MNKNKQQNDRLKPNRLITTLKKNGLNTSIKSER